MKRCIALILIALLTLSLCACGNQTKKVERMLVQGSWTRQFDALGTNCTIIYTFEENNSALIVSQIGNSEFTNEASYSVKEDRIILAYDSGDVFDIFYEYENGNLKLHMVGSEGDVFPLIHTP